MFLIFFSSILLAFDNPLNNTQSTYSIVLSILNVVLNWIFVIECCLNIFVYGLCKHKGSYLRDPWNILDFVVAISPVVSTLLGGHNVSTIRVARLLRALRPLRVIRKYKGMRLVVNALFNCFTNVGNVVLVTIIVILAFAIIAVRYSI